MNPLLLPILGLLWLPSQACAFVYWAGSIEGWVVDGETGKPVEGAIVVAHWQLKGGWEGGVPVGQLQIYEAVTDASGRYFFPSWGPKFAFSGRLRSESPRIFVFKPGYRYLELDNEYHLGMDTTRSDWNKKTVKLAPFSGTPRAYAQHLEALSDSLWIVGYDSGEPCNWESFPRMLGALAGLEAGIRAAGGPRTVFSQLKSNQILLAKAGCRSIEKVVGP